LTLSNLHIKNYRMWIKNGLTYFLVLVEQNARLGLMLASWTH
jgi:hypothetical protein